MKARCAASGIRADWWSRARAAHRISLGAPAAGHRLRLEYGLLAPPADEPKPEHGPTTRALLTKLRSANALSVSRRAVDDADDRALQGTPNTEPVDRGRAVNPHLITDVTAC